MTRGERRAAKRLRRLEDKRDDLREHLAEWGFGMKPSMRRRLRERVGALNERIEALDEQRDRGEREQS